MAISPANRTQAEKDKLLKDAIAKIAQGSSSGVRNPLLGGVAPGVSVPDISNFRAFSLTMDNAPAKSETELEAIELEKARQNAARRILNDPNSRNNPDFMLKQLEEIAAGGKPKSGGIGGAIRGAIGAGLEGLGYVLNRPLAVVTSGLKELTDIPSGQASFGDFIKQSVAKDTAPSKYLGKTGVGWLDQVIGFAADIALDPLTYVGFGAAKWAGREGRLNLASFLAKEENLAKAPTVLKKIQDGSVGRLGVWALDKDELAQLGMRRGLNWSFGAQSIIGKEGTLAGKLSEGTATAVGKTFAKGRAALSDTGLFTPLQKLTAKQAEKAAGLTMYGRRAKDADEVVDRLTQLASYNSAMKANAKGRVLESRLSFNTKSLVNDVMNFEESTGRRIHEVLEGVRLPADDVEQALADRVRLFYDETPELANNITAEFGARRGTAPFLIEKSPGYVNHVLSDEALDLFQSKKFQQSPWASSLKKSLGISKDDFTSGPSILQRRTLKTGDRFLGVKLESNNGGNFATLGEINKIAKDKLGVELFDSNTANLLNNYVNSIVTQAKRVAFADGLFDYGPDVIRAVSPKVIGNEIVDKTWNDTLTAYDNIITPVLDELAQTTEGVLGPRLALAEAVLSSQPGSRLLTKTQLNGVQTVLRQTQDLLRRTDDVVRNLDDDTKAAYDSVAAPLRARLNAIDNAIATGDEVSLISDLGLNDLYRRLYPDATDVPNPKEMAEDIIDGVQELLGEEYSAGALKALDDAIAGAGGNVKTSANTAVARLQSELDSLQKTKPNATAQIANKKAQLEAATSRLDESAALRMSKQEWDSSVGSVYMDDVQKIVQGVAASPPPGSAGEITKVWLDRTTKVLDQLNAPGLALSPAEREVLEKVITQAKGLEAQIALAESAQRISAQALDAAFSKENIGAVADKITKGWETIESLGVKMPPEVRDQLFGKVAELKTAQGAAKFWQMYSAYNKFFKVSAMLSPGFVARNGYTAAFNNFVAGVTVKETAQGLRFATSVMRNGIDAALEKLPKGLRNKYAQALEVAYATGAGQTADDILAPILSKKGKKIIQGKIVGNWAKANEGMELSARFSLALSQLNRGANFEDAVGNVARYHFDYGNLSQLDEFMLKFIPFWTFASRNVPLQIVNQIAQPKMYRMWESAQRNFGVSEEEMANYPEWLRQRQPLQLPFMPQGTVLNLDIPHLDMEDQIRMFSDPVRLLSQASPVWKLPVELMGNRQLWSGVPFSNKPSPIRGPLDFPAYAAGVIGGAAGKMPTTGQYYTNSKAAYAVPNLIPTLAQLQRLIPELGGKESYQDRAGSSRAAYFGLPFRRVSQNEQFNELLRRQFAISDYMSGLTRTGQLEKKEGRSSL